MTRTATTWATDESVARREGVFPTGGAGGYREPFKLGIAGSGVVSHRAAQPGMLAPLGLACRAALRVTAVERVVVVVPAHDEQELLDECLRALQLSAHAIPVPTELVVVLDACTDDTASVVDRRARIVVIDQRNVGAARAAGFAAAGGRCGSETWFATTDADTVVGPEWLRAQLRRASAGAQMVLGTVVVDSWGPHSPQVRERYGRRYRSVDGHRHVHGANLGLRADTYWSAGGFAALDTGEDVDLVHRVRAAGAPVCWSAELPVRTSSRLEGRAPEGFAAHLRALEAQPNVLVS